MLLSNLCLVFSEALSSFVIASSAFLRVVCLLVASAMTSGVDCTVVVELDVVILVECDVMILGISVFPITFVKSATTAILPFQPVLKLCFQTSVIGNCTGSCCDFNSRLGSFVCACWIAFVVVGLSNHFIIHREMRFSTSTAG